MYRLFDMVGNQSGGYMECVADVQEIRNKSWSGIAVYERQMYPAMIPPQLHPKRLWKNKPSMQPYSVGLSIPTVALRRGVVVDAVAVSAVYSRERIVTMKGGFVRSGHDGRRSLRIAGKIARI
jgi:hypothetical protein